MMSSSSPFILLNIEVDDDIEEANVRRAIKAGQKAGAGKNRKASEALVVAGLDESDVDAPLLAKGKKKGKEKEKAEHIDIESEDEEENEDGDHSVIPKTTVSPIHIVIIEAYLIRFQARDHPP